MNSLLTVRNLNITLFKNNKHYTNIVSGLNFDIKQGQAIGIVGESGCGKSVTAAALLRILPYPDIQISSGTIFFEDQEISSWSIKKFNNQFRWIKTSIIFQDSSQSFNPVKTIGFQINEVLTKLHKTAEIGKQLLIECGLNDIDRIWHSYPHQLSGGMKQRVSIAIALIGNPQLLIADEPTTASDATIQLQILKLLKKLQKTRNMAIMLISHDLNVIKYLCDYVYIIYCGQIVEEQTVGNLFSAPLHHYTSGLIDAIDLKVNNNGELNYITGQMAPMNEWHKNCAFSNRCLAATTECKAQKPLLQQASNGKVACFHPLNIMQ